MVIAEGSGWGWLSLTCADQLTTFSCNFLRLYGVEYRIFWKMIKGLPLDHLLNHSVCVMMMIIDDDYEEEQAGSPVLASSWIWNSRVQSHIPASPPGNKVPQQPASTLPPSKAGGKTTMNISCRRETSIDGKPTRSFGTTSAVGDGELVGLD